MWKWRDFSLKRTTVKTTTMENSDQLPKIAARQRDEKAEKNFSETNARLIIKDQWTNDDLLGQLTCAHLRSVRSVLFSASGEWRHQTYPMVDPANDASNVKLFLICISFHITTRPVDCLHGAMWNRQESKANISGAWKTTKLIVNLFFCRFIKRDARHLQSLLKGIICYFKRWKRPVSMSSQPLIHITEKDHRHFSLSRTFDWLVKVFTIYWVGALVQSVDGSTKNLIYPSLLLCYVSTQYYAPFSPFSCL